MAEAKAKKNSRVIAFFKEVKSELKNEIGFSVCIDFSERLKWNLKKLFGPQENSL